MKTTGERIIPESYQNVRELQLIYLTHIQSYKLILPEIMNKTVLDFGCGEGYGAHMLAQNAQKVVGIDIDKETISYAQSKYLKDNLEFKNFESTEELSSLLGNNTFDVIISYQVIEHIRDAESYLKQINRLLKPGGKFFLATPNARTRLLPFQNPWNQFHVIEYTEESLKTILKREFSNVEVKGLGAIKELTDLEQKRANRNKWLLFPFTNKLIPESIRQFSLRTIKRIMSRTKQNSNNSQNQQMPNYDENSVFLTTEGVGHCPNLFAICSNNFN